MAWSIFYFCLLLDPHGSKDFSALFSISWLLFPLDNDDEIWNTWKRIVSFFLKGGSPDESFIIKNHFFLLLFVPLLTEYPSNLSIHQNIKFVNTRTIEVPQWAHKSNECFEIDNVQLNLKGCVTCMPPPSANKTAHSGFETQRRHH